MGRWHWNANKYNNLKLNKENQKWCKEQWDNLEPLYEMIDNKEYREQVRRIMTERKYTPSRIKMYLQLDNYLIANFNPLLDDEWFKYADLRLFQYHVRGLFCGRPYSFGETVDAYTLFHVLGEEYKYTDNKKIGMWAKDVLNVLFKIDEPDARKKLSNLTITYDDDWSWNVFYKVIKEYNEMTWLDKKWVDIYVSENRFIEREWNFE